MVLSPYFLDACPAVTTGVGSTFRLEFDIFTLDGNTQNGSGYLHFGLVKQFFVSSVSFPVRMAFAWKDQFVEFVEPNFSAQCRSGASPVSSR